MNGVHDMNDVITRKPRGHKYQAPLGQPSAAPNMFKEIPEMLLYEELARARIRELHEGVHGVRGRHAVRSTNRWIPRGWRTARRSRRS